MSIEGKSTIKIHYGGKVFSLQDNAYGRRVVKQIDAGIKTGGLVKFTHDDGKVSIGLGHGTPVHIEHGHSGEDRGGE